MPDSASAGKSLRPAINNSAVKYQQPIKFMSSPGLIPLRDGRNWQLDGALKVRLPDGRIVEIPDKFKTDLASVPPLGVVGGIVMLLGWLVQHLTEWADVMVLLGFLICIASAYIKAYGKYTYAAVFHDWMWRTQAFSFVVSNWYFLCAMKAEATALWVRALMWFNVMLFGVVIYTRYKKHFHRVMRLAHSNFSHD